MLGMIYIQWMNLSSLDLNLLVALDALLGEASVSRAAQRIGLSQPATSHALARLREVVGDPLLVRVGARMELTPRAQSLRAPLGETLEQVRTLFVSEGFDPATSTRRFALMIPDIVVDLLMMPVVERVAAAAPHVRLDIVPWLAPDMVTAERAREVDLVLSCRGDAYPGFHRQKLYTDKDALAVRRGHPVGRRLKQLPAFLDARHVAVISQGQRLDMIDEWLLDAGVERRIALAVPSYLQAARLAARTDLVAFVPRRLIASLSGPLGLMTVDPPLDPGVDEQFMFYPTRAQNDPGSAWLRGLVLDVGRALERDKAR
ncbi:MAG: LysR family transcriptional regulator [Alphaproteobacteria bacterium]|nr:LysR family transcriptional regulator [Alphaproteobacteria bacterium]